MEKYKYTKEFLAFMAVFFMVLIVFGFPTAHVFDRVTDDFGLPSNEYEDTNNLYTDTIATAYLVDNKNAPQRDKSQYSILVPFAMTNNYEEQKPYTMSVSLVDTHLFHTFPKQTERRYKTSHGRYSPTVRLHRYVPVITDLMMIGSIPDSREEFHFRNKKTCRQYNPGFIAICDSQGPLEIALDPGATSDAFYFDFPISYWNEAFVQASGSTYTLRAVRGSGYYPITIEEVVDCREEMEEKDTRCDVLTT